MYLVTVVWLGLVACGDFSLPTDAPPLDDNAAPEGTDDDVSSTSAGGAAGAGEAPITFKLTPIECETGEYQVGRNDKGVEQWCDRNGAMQGLYKKFHLNGKRAVEGQYINNNPSGTWHWWHENGEKASRGTYDAKGKQIGNWTWWHDNGEPAQAGDFMNGRRSGTWTTWHPNGAKAEEGFYVNGQRDGTWAYWKDDGELDKVVQFQHGQLVENE